MIKDVLGNEIQKGDKVVYNLSGELAVGIVINYSVKEKTRYSVYLGEFILDRVIYKIFINKMNEEGYLTGHVSKVTNNNSIIIINKIP